MYHHMKQERLASVRSGFGAVNRRITSSREENLLLEGVCKDLSGVEGYKFVGIIRFNDSTEYYTSSNIKALSESFKDFSSEFHKRMPKGEKHEDFAVSDYKDLKMQIGQNAFSEELEEKGFYLFALNLTDEASPCGWLFVASDRTIDIEEELGLLSVLAKDISYSIWSMRLYREANAINLMFQFLSEKSPVGVFSLDKDFAFDYTNKNTNTIFGFATLNSQYSEFGERSLKGLNIFDFVNNKNKERIMEVFDSLSQNSISLQNLEFELVGIDGKVRNVELSLSRVPPCLSNTTYVGVVADVTREFEFRRQIKENEEKFRSLAEGAVDLIMIVDRKTGRVIFANSKFFKVMGVGEVVLEDRSVEEFLPLDVVRAVCEKGEPVKTSLKTVTNKELQIEIICSTINFGGRENYLMICRDISEREKLEREKDRLYKTILAVRNVNQLLVSVENKRELYQQTCNILSNLDYVEGVVIETFSRGKRCEIFSSESSLKGAELEKLIGKVNLQALLTKRELITRTYIEDESSCQLRDYFSNVSIKSFIAVPIVRKGEVVGVIALFSKEENPFQLEEVEFVREVAGDISVGDEKITINKKLRHLLERETSHRKLSEALRRATLSIVSKVDLKEILCKILQASIDVVGTACSGNIAIVEEGKLSNLATKGYKKFNCDQFVKEFLMDIEEFPNCKKALERKNGIIVHDTLNDKSWVPVKELSWIRSNLAVPLVVKENLYGLLRLDSDKPNAFSEEDIKKLLPLASAAAIAIENSNLVSSLKHELTLKQVYEDELIKSKAEIQENLDKFISATSKIVEVKDPYTAGHQRKVSMIAELIATEMRLKEKEIYDIKTAGLLHDIGKIYVPAEILSKPSRLTEAEYEIVKYHSRVSYDVLAGITLLESVAKIVLQHHERLDGSGYPSGIKNGEICIGARIIAVADVFDAMVTHRPYRPALGVEKAVKEIDSKKGVLYDARVVDTFVKILREGKIERYWQS